ncbi:GIY-YIG nuclease family protein [Burkholderia ubonensis]|uniref:GIY-YIG nuclease family protein n=1 Tax=Burkholderia ubonensis TaxID=101571 RepID=UPI0007C850B8|nr:GIY-YIG nuclease family protein [Burkholderia ubonensis]
MNRLLQIGFQVVGQWQLVDGKLKIDIQRHGAQRNVLYAFVCDGEVKYVGKSTQTLRARMGGYLSPGPTSETNKRVRQLIFALLESGATVELYALPDNGLMHYGPFHLNLAAGLEDSIIRTLVPEWNMTAGRTRKLAACDEEPEGQEDVDRSPVDETSAASAPVVATFEFMLQPSYWKKGFFNSGIAASPLLGAGGDNIEIFFGDETAPIMGTINRSSTGNNSPRIFGGPELTRRFQALAQATHMLVEVLSPTSIRIRPSAGMMANG